MVCFRFFTVASLFVIFATVLSATLPDRKKTFTLHQTKPRSDINSGPAHVLSAYQRLGKRAPDNLIAAAAVNKGTVVASPSEFDAAYLSAVTIGSQTFDVGIDTGSDLLWVFSSELPSADHNSYDPSKSNTSRLQQGTGWQTCYGGSHNCVFGELYLENVNVGGVVSSNQLIGVATAITPNFAHPDGFEGIFGLAFTVDSAGNLQHSTFFDNIRSSLSAPLFTADLKKKKPGSYDFGFIDDSKYTGRITYVPVNTDQGEWEFKVDGYAVGESNIQPVSIDVMADTGTSTVLFPDDIVDAYYAAVPEAVHNETEAGYIFPCGTALPSLTLVIGGYKAVVPGSYFEFVPTSASGITCYGGIQAIGDVSSDTSLNILGDVFLKSQFVVFEFENNDPRIGFAPKPL